MDVTLTWLLVATGFTGALTLRFLLKRLEHLFTTPPNIGVHFSPKGGCTEAVVGEIKRARHEILVQAYSFTSEPISASLVDAKKRGVHVVILLDKSNETEQHTDLHLFMEQGLAPLIDAKHAIAHNKVMVIDRKTLITGSFNFTNQAESENAENLLIIKGHPELISAYRTNFDAHKSHCQPATKPVPAAHGKRAA